MRHRICEIYMCFNAKIVIVSSNNEPMETMVNGNRIALAILSKTQHVSVKWCPVVRCGLFT